MGEAKGSGGVSGGASRLRRFAQSGSASPAAPSEYRDETAPRAAASAIVVADAAVAYAVFAERRLIFLFPLFKFLLGEE